MSLDFSHTCPRIDREIESAKSILEDQFVDAIAEACPLLPDELIREQVQAWVEGTYSLLEDCFEAVRETNEEMRAAANYQIEALEQEITDLKDEIRNIQEAIDVSG